MSSNLAVQQLAFDLSDGFILPEADNSAFNKRYSPLWLCLYLPQLALDLKKQTNEFPQLVVEDIKGKYSVHCCCDAALQCGIHSGMTLSAAYALAPQLITYHRDPKKEQQVLKKLADWAQQFTPSVSIDAEKSCILLEIRASLKLFDGLLALQQKVQQQCQKTFHYTINLAVAPTPLASQLLARFSNAPLIEEEAALRSVLGRLSINTLLLDKKTEEKLHKIGVETLKELWRLPRDSLARRFGKNLITHLDKLLGTQADPLLLHQAPLKFDEHIELPYEASNNQTVLAAARQLLEHLQSFLTQHDAGIIKLCLRLSHFNKTHQDVMIGLRQCTRNAEYVASLLQEKLDRLSLPAAVCEVRLIVDEVLPFIAQNQQIFPSHLLADNNNHEQHDPQWQSLLEQIQNRFGLQAVQYLQTLDDHRPEFAWAYHYQGKPQTNQQTQPRPLWLLTTPQLLPQKRNTPCSLGPLTALHGPERIESGWWEDNAIHRDYYVAQDVDHRRLWIYRDLINKHWYLHGYFG